jgi:CheY-like chemotaxis protein
VPEQKSKGLKFGKKKKKHIDYNLKDAIVYEVQGESESDLESLMDSSKKFESSSMSGNAEYPNESSKVRISYSFADKPLTRIIVAEDQIINMEVIKSKIREEGLLDRCEFCYNGQEAVDRAL